MENISVTWDVRNFPLPKVLADSHSIAQNIRSALISLSPEFIQSSVSTDVFGANQILPHPLSQPLSTTAVRVTASSKVEFQLEPPHADKAVHGAAFTGWKEIKNAFSSLKGDLLMPTLRNLEEWSRYWGGPRDIGRLLSQALEMGLIAKVNVPPGNTLVYRPSNTELWHCVDLNDTQHNYCRRSWKTLRQYLLDNREWRLFSKSQSRYEAAQILKESGIPIISGYSVAEILHFLHLLKNRGWIWFHKNDWLPLTRNVERISGSGKVGNNPTKKGQRRDMVEFIYPDEEMLWILRDWITEKVRWNDGGYDISLIRRDFWLDTDLDLDLQSLGYDSLLTFIFEELWDVVTLKPSVRYKNVWMIWPR